MGAWAGEERRVDDHFGDRAHIITKIGPTESGAMWSCLRSWCSGERGQEKEHDPEVVPANAAHPPDGFNRNMPTLPPVVWIAAAVAVIVLLALCGATAYVVLRAPVRHRIVGWRGGAILALLVAAAVPWLVVRLAPITVALKIHGIWQLLGWLILGLGAFVLLVLAPIAAVLAGVVWLVGRRRYDRIST
jgi:hypothetical protein